jgi:hypothetical protein
MQNEFRNAPMAARAFLFLACHLIENHVIIDFGGAG